MARQGMTCAQKQAGKMAGGRGTLKPHQVAVYTRTSSKKNELALSVRFLAIGWWSTLSTHCVCVVKIVDI